MKKHVALSTAIASALLAACTNGAAQNPSVSTAPITGSSGPTLQFVVGTANTSALDPGTVGLNTVVSFRQANGLSAFLADTPSITGPAAFIVPDTSAIASPYTGAPMTGNGDGGSGTNRGTNTINGAVQTLDPNNQPPKTTFGQSGGAFSYGFAPLNSDQTGDAYYPGNSRLDASLGADDYWEPFYSANAVPLLGGPPVYPFIYDGTYPPAFAGFSQGWTAFELATATVPTGTYTLNATIASSNSGNLSYSAPTATLTNPTPMTAPTITGLTEDGKGGLTGTVTPSTDARTLVTYVYVYDLALFATGSPDRSYTVGPFAGTAPAAFTLPDNLGSCGNSSSPQGGCQNTSAAKPTITAKDPYFVVAVSYDYDPKAIASYPGGNSSATPLNGITQADLAIGGVAFASHYSGGIAVTQGARSAEFRRALQSIAMKRQSMTP